MQTHNFKIYYAVIPSSSITNTIEPSMVGIEEKLIHLTPKQREENWVYNKKDFYENLEKSILNEGFRNPILIQSGYCGDGRRKYLNDQDDFLCCDRNGGSRLWIAQRHNLNIPCIISDFDNRFSNSNFELLSNETEISVKFKDTVSIKIDISRRTRKIPIKV